VSKACTRVDFYLLTDSSVHSARVFCSRLAEKAWKLGHRVWIRTDNAETTDLLDNVLWTFSDGSFVPHAKVSDPDAENSPVLIGDTAPRVGVNLLINLGHDVPEYCDAYPRIAEIINDDAALKQQGRARYAHYQKNNYTLEHHTIN
jgi:DNA polymerase-3 subunit chi